MRFASALLLVFATSFGAAAAPAALCGGFDVARMTNAELETLLFNLVPDDRKLETRVQCGLPGETLNLCGACATSTTEDMMTVLRPMVGAKSHLNWHANWHKIRAAKEHTPGNFAKFQKAGWIAADATAESFRAHLQGGDLHGEDFFYMHRMMVKMTQLELAARGQPCMAPWTGIPRSVDDAEWPIPRSFATPEKREENARRLAGLAAQLDGLRSVKFLRSVTLNRLGQIVEPAIHQNLHLLYQSAPRCSPEAKAQGFECDDLVPVETSPLNKHFWKIHGLVDGLVGDWLSANGYREISVSCGGREACYEWQGTWIGKPPKPASAP